MNQGTDRLFDLLPLVYRMRDADQGYPLRDLLRVLGTQADVIERDIDRLYDNWFIETCDDWMVPYIGDLIGYTSLPEAATLGQQGADAARLGRVLAPRADVANTIGARCRKGTLSLLEDLARDAAGWPSRAVEFHRLLGWMQHLGHLRPTRGGFAGLRDPGPLQSLRWQQGAFDPFAHTVDVRRMASLRGRGRYHIPHVGLFAFRLRSYPVTITPAYCVEDIGPRCYTFSVLGHDSPLFQRPVAEAGPSHIAEEHNLPVPLRRFRFAERGAKADYANVSAELYGAGKSVLVFAPDWPTKGQGVPVPRELLVPCDLSGWRYHVPRGKLAIDPERGRMAFPANQRPKHGVWVSYQYGFAGDLGGGEYARRTPELEDALRYVVHATLPQGKTPLPKGHFDSLTEALAAWTAAKDAAESTGAPRSRALIIELAESGVYEGRIDLQLEPGEAIQIRAAERTRPVLRLLDLRASHPDAMTISGQGGSRVLLDGLLIAGRGIEVQGPADEQGAATPQGDLCELLIRHCTLVPGWALQCDCNPKRPGEPSVTLSGTRAALRIEHSIVGPISVTSPMPRSEPSSVSLCDSILDATGFDRVALGAPDEMVAHVEARFARCTVIGEVQAHAIAHAEDSIFAGKVRVLRRQHGCMRFCYVAAGSRTPRRFHCLPDKKPLKPQFMSTRYGSVDYMRLTDGCSVEIRTGASDRSAMGAWHDLYEPQREANLAMRLEENVPAGVDAGIIFAS
jgi:hypothetical protein